MNSTAFHSRRSFLSIAGASVLLSSCSKVAATADATEQPFDNKDAEQWRALTAEQWRERLGNPLAFAVLREEATERPFTSELNFESREGIFACAGCELPLFSSTTKYDSGTGWPSFYDVLPGAVGTKTDNKLWLPRTEYHCARCLGHQGHVFPDGPAPTGLRYCNNGVALTFLPAEA